MKKLVISVCLACAAAPAFAQDPAPAAEEQVDGERLALATRVAGRLLPDGSYARMMNGSMEDMMDAAFGAMLDMDVTTLLGALTEEERAKLDPKMLDMSMRELMEICDPHFAERLSITQRTMFRELTPFMTRMEPPIRAALADALARRLDATVLGEMARFFDTPAGSAYAAESITIWSDPAVTTVMTGAMPAMMAEMPAIMQTAAAATAHLPPPPEAEQLKERLLKLASK